MAENYPSRHMYKIAISGYKIKDGNSIKNFRQNIIMKLCKRIIQRLRSFFLS